jgi:hypothetical protein
VLGVAEGDAVGGFESADSGKTGEAGAEPEGEQCVPEGGECTGKSCCLDDTSHGCYREMVDNGGAWTGRMVCMPNP